MVLIVNPYATEVTPARIADVVEALESRCELVTWRTRQRGHARELAESAADQADAIVVYSGDGTYNEAINGAGGHVPFGFIPGGGASVFARALGLPRDPVRAAGQILDALDAGRTASITLGKINGRRFCFSAGVGFDAEIVRRVDGRGRDGDGRRAGTDAFLASVLKTLWDLRFRIPPQLEIAGVGRAALLVVVNGHPYTFVGRVPVQLSARAEFELGLDFVAPRSVGPTAIPGLTLRLFRGSLEHDPDLFFGHDLDRLEVRCDRPLPVQADGEDLGDYEEIVFEAEREALAVLR